MLVFYLSKRLASGVRRFKCRSAFHVALLATALALGVSAQAPLVYYVSPNGSDSNGGSQFAPFRTIQHAIDVSVPGNRVIVLEGRYSGPGNRDLDFEGKAITVQSRNPDDPACVRATVLDSEGEGVIARFIHDEGPATVLAGFTIVMGEQRAPLSRGIPGYLEMSVRARPTTKWFRLETPALSSHSNVTPQVTGMPNGTPTGGRAWDGHNPYVQPAATTDYWGSGDIDGDGAVTAADALLAQQMASHSIPATVAADVNGDGKVDTADYSLILAAAAGGSLPGWWNKLTSRDQRNSWVDKVMAIEPTKYYTDPVWWFQCIQFSLQTQLHGSFYRNDLFGTYFSGGQTWFNIPLYSVSLSIGHAINAILVGDNPLNMDDWRFIEPQGDYDISRTGGYMPSGSTVDIFVWDHVQVGGGSYMGGQAAVSFLMGDNGTYTVISHDPNLVLTRPAQAPVVVPDNHPDLWNPHVLSAGNGMLLFERERADMTRADDIHLTDLPLADPPPAVPLVLDSQFTRLLDVRKGPDQTVHLLWAGGANYLPGVFHSVLDTNTRTLQSTSRITPGSREIHGGRIVITSNGEVHAFWSARASSGNAGYTTAVYWSKWTGSSWTSEQNIGPSGYFSDFAGDWHENDTARYFFDATTDKNGLILMVWAACDNSGNITIRSTSYSGTWSAPADIEATGIAGGVALARDGAGIVHLAYWRTGSNPSYTSFGNLLHRSYDGTSWSSPDTVDGGSYASTPRMAAGANSLYLVWQRDTFTQRVPVWRRWANSTWSADHILAVRSGADAYYPSADVLSDGRLAVAWSSRSADRVSIETAYAQELNLSLSVAHTGSFTQGDTGDAYRITVANAGQSSTAGSITVTDTLPAGLTATSISGTGWSCSLGQLSCTRGDSLAAGANYPVITVLVNVASNAAANVTNSAALSSVDEALTGGSTASDPTAIAPKISAAALSITKYHTGSFSQGQQGAIYTVTVSNSAQAGPTSGTVTIAETLPAGLSLVTMSGSGWSCAGTNCSRSDALAPGSAYPPIQVTVNVAVNAASPQVNTVTVSGGGSISANATDSTTVTYPSDLYLANLTLSSGALQYTATNSVTAGTNVVFGGAASVTFVAGSQIVLNPGFHATGGGAGITFRAHISPGIH